MSLAIRFASWNVNWMTRSQTSHVRKIDYFAAQPWDVLALQEVTPELAEAITSSAIADECRYPGDLRGERFASALLVRNGFRLSRVSLIAGLPQPRRGISAVVHANGVEFEVLSWHAPNAAKREHRFIKRAGYVAFIEWVAARRGPLLVGTDANHGSFFVREEDFPSSPMKLDFPKNEWWEENSWWTQPEPEMRDAWITYLDEQPDVLDRVRSRWTGGPSAVSYTRGSKAKPTPDRFDYVLASPEFAIRHVAYDYEGGCAAGSDHAFLRAEVAIGL